MLPVEIIYTQGMLILQARSSELVIIPQHVVELQKLDQPKEFSDYFVHKALVNRPARKLFEAWLKKDQTIWQRIFKTIHSDKKAEASA